MQFSDTSEIASWQDEQAPEERAPSRALIVLEPDIALGKALEAYRYAPFLAHLLAVKDQHPQTRTRRRAEPDEALAAYRATAALTRFQ